MVRLTREQLEELRVREQKDKEAFDRAMDDDIEYQRRFSTLANRQQKIYGLRMYPLALEFSYIYKLLLREKKIDLKESLKQSKKTKWYDVDIISILYLMKLIHTANNTKEKIPLPNRKLIVIWWLVLDEDYQKYYSKIWPKKLKEVVWKHKKPHDYEQYLTDWDLNKLKNNNSFHKYLTRAYENWLKDKVILFLWTILSEIDEYAMYGLSPKWYNKTILKTYEIGFSNIINDLEIWRSGMGKITYIIRKNNAMWYKECLDVAVVQYKNKLYKRLKFR